MEARPKASPQDCNEINANHNNATSSQALAGIMAKEQQGLSELNNEKLKPTEDNKWEEEGLAVNNMVQRKIDRRYFNIIEYKATKETEIEEYLNKKWNEFCDFQTWKSKVLTIKAKRNSRINNQILCLIIKDIYLGYHSKNISALWNELEFNLANAKEITDEGLDYLGSYMKYCFKGLKAINFSFSNLNEISAGAYKNLASQISQNLPTLKSLSLGFDGNDITNKTLSKILSGLGNDMTNLQQFGLSLVRCQELTEDCLKFIVRSLMNRFPNLSKLELCVKECENLSSREFAILAQELSVHANRFTALDLNFDMLSSDAPTNFITRAHNLQSLTLSFYGDISKKPLQQLIGCIGSDNPKLEHLTLQFKGHCVDRDLELVATQINKHLHKLKSFSFSCHRSKQVTTPAIVNLVSSIKNNLSNLEKLFLDFSQCTSLNESLVLDLDLWNFRHFSYLRMFSLYLTLVKEISKEAKQSLQKTLSYIPVVVIH